MNILSFAPRAALAAIALGVVSATATFADTATTSSTTTTGTSTNADGWKHHHHGFGVLTADERAQMKKAREAAFAADPTLETQKAALKQKFEALKTQDGTLTEQDKQALHAQAETFHQNLKAAELKADPTLAPVLTKLEAAHANHHHQT